MTEDIQKRVSYALKILKTYPVNTNSHTQSIQPRINNCASKENINKNNHC